MRSVRTHPNGPRRFGPMLLAALLATVGAGSALGAAAGSPAHPVVVPHLYYNVTSAIAKEGLAPNQWASQTATLSRLGVTYEVTVGQSVVRGTVEGGLMEFNNSTYPSLKSITAPTSLDAVATDGTSFLLGGYDDLYQFYPANHSLVRLTNAFQKFTGGYYYATLSITWSRGLYYLLGQNTSSPAGALPPYYVLFDYSPTTGVFHNLTSAFPSSYLTSTGTTSCCWQESVFGTRAGVGVSLFTQAGPRFGFLYPNGTYVDHSASLPTWFGTCLAAGFVSGAASTVWRCQANGNSEFAWNGSSLFLLGFDRVNGSSILLALDPRTGAVTDRSGWLGAYAGDYDVLAWARGVLYVGGCQITSSGAITPSLLAVHDRKGYVRNLSAFLPPSLLVVESLGGQGRSVFVVGGTSGHIDEGLLVAL